MARPRQVQPPLDCVTFFQPQSSLLHNQNQSYHPSLYIRDLSDDASHRSYTKVAQTYVEVVRSLPPPPAGSKVYLELGNEMNGSKSSSILCCVFF